MRYADLYRECKNAIKRYLLSDWCGNSPLNDQQRHFKNQIVSLLDDEILAPEYSVPLVQYMESYVSVAPNDAQYAIDKVVARYSQGNNYFVRDLWDVINPGHRFTPYVHQKESWNHLLQGESIVVTTGTGSGKTECFMLPVVKDILENVSSRGRIQAIFMYPLNALMEDQKSRLLKLVKGTDVRFCVYNGNLPERENDLKHKVKFIFRSVKDYVDNPVSLEFYKSLVNSLLGITKNEVEIDNNLTQRLHELDQRNLQVESNDYVTELLRLFISQYSNIVLTRESMRQQPPEIMITNPSMVEYMLLREEDQQMLTAGDLRWFVIDETHTFIGASAVELSMQIKRLLLAFNKNVDDVRFATSSATLTNSGNVQEDEQVLKEFIGGIVGKEPQNIFVISGEQNHLAQSERDDEVRDLRSRLEENEYVRLDELVQGNTNEERLEVLDRLCERSDNLRVKLHLFFRVLNQGLKVCLSDIDGDYPDVLKIYADVPEGRDEELTPFLELKRCCHCGEYLAVGQVDDNIRSLSAIERQESDLFNDNPSVINKNTVVIGLNNANVRVGNATNNIVFDIDGNSITPQVAGTYVLNTKLCCPYCQHKLIKAEDENQDADSNLVNSKSFRLYPSDINTIIAPVILSHIDEDPQYANCPHAGQQILSFVDNRKEAARSTLIQNKHVEELYLYNFIVRELEKYVQGNATQQMLAEINRQRDDVLKRMSNPVLNIQESQNLTKQLVELNTRCLDIQTQSLSWSTLAERLMNDDKINKLYKHFTSARDLARLEKENDNAQIEQLEKELKLRYVYSIMLSYLARPRVQGTSPEMMGLFRVHYPKIDAIQSLPQAIEDFNVLLPQDKRIEVADWRNLLTIFMDRAARSNDSFYVHHVDGQINIDIFKCQRFAAEKPSRRPIGPRVKMRVEPGQGLYSHVVYLLASLFATPQTDLHDVIRNHSKDLTDVMYCIWDTLKEEGLLQQGDTYDVQKQCWKADVDESHDNQIEYRLNVEDISFSLCSGTIGFFKINDTEIRPSAIDFKGFSPFYNRSHVNKRESFETWEAVSFLNQDLDTLHNYMANYRPKMWRYLWGSEGAFATVLDNVYGYQDGNFFIQAEHTAQIDKSISSKYQNDFKEHMINILACSTTMEMGVDIGQLQVVLMNSVPPYPCNYKQRAGRSGRRAQTRKSLSVTLCGSDSLGARTLRNPLEIIINRKIIPPKVSLYDNPTIVQRHINSYCLWLALRAYNTHPNHIQLSFDELKIGNFYTRFYFDENPQTHHWDRSQILINVNGQRHWFIPSTTDLRGLDFYYTNSNPVIPVHYDAIFDEIRNIQNNALSSLLQKTSFEGREQEALDQVIDSLSATTGELDDELYGIAIDIQNRLAPADPRPGVLVNQNDWSTLMRIKGVKRLTLAYSRILDRGMIEFFSNSRFIPNANMPVGVIEFDVNYSTVNYDPETEESNPSYSLKEALSQYSPGKTVILKNSIYEVGGMAIKGKFQDAASYVSLYKSSTGHKVSTNSDDINQPYGIWDRYNSRELRILRPCSFLPDFSKDTTRYDSIASRALVSAQLIGTEEWNSLPGLILFQTRSSKESPDARILYYNEGAGNGYCYCTKCGKITVEPLSAGTNSDRNTPADFNNSISRNDERFHYNIRPVNGKKMICSMARNQSTGAGNGGAHTWIIRHAVIGDFIQTDYTEFKFFDQNGIEIHDEKVLNTLGILLCLSYSESYGINRGDLDFMITANKRLCIFDSTPGGSGYSNKLSCSELMFKILDYCRNLIRNTQCNVELLDKYTISYEHRMNRAAVSEWLDLEANARLLIPQELEQEFGQGKVRTSSLQNIERKVRNNSAGSDINIFVSDSFNQYNFDDGNSNWRNLVMRDILSPRNKDRNHLYVYGNVNSLPLSIKTLMMTLDFVFTTKESLDAIFNLDDIYPLAYIGRTLYFTRKIECSHMNSMWAHDEVFETEVDLDFHDAVELDLTIDQARERILLIDANVHTDTSEISKKARDDASTRLVQSFIQSMGNDRPTIEVVYQDQHLKSMISFVAALQFIEKYLEEFHETIGAFDYRVTFEVEKYNDSGSGYLIYSNLDYGMRNVKLAEVYRNWVNAFSQQHTDIRCLNPQNAIRVLRPREAPHWRNFTFTCGDASLEIDPNGGVINEWFYDETGIWNKTEYSKVGAEDRIPIYSRSQIKYSYELKLPDND